jgi:hypothetical protein
MIVPDGTPTRRSMWGKLALTTGTSAAAIVAVCGAFYLGTVFSSATTEPKAVASAAPETTGSAPSVPEYKASADAEPSAPKSTEQSEAADCQSQTWPYIARPCVSNDESKRGVRVIATDKLADPVVSMLQAPPEVVTNRRVSKPAAQDKTSVASSGFATAPTDAWADEERTLVSGAALARLSIDDAAKPNEARADALASPAATADHQTAPAVASTADASDARSGSDATAESKFHRGTARDKPKRKLAKKTDAGRSRVARGVSDEDDQADFSAAESRSGKLKGRIVERWNEREYQVPSEEGRGARRVIVTSRDESSVGRSYTARSADAFPNIFGAIFGGD